MSSSRQGKSKNKKEETPGNTEGTIDSFLKQGSTSKSKPSGSTNSGPSTNMAASMSDGDRETIVYELKSFMTSLADKQTSDICAKIDSMKANLNLVTERVTEVEKSVEMNASDIVGMRQDMAARDANLTAMIDDLRRDVLETRSYSRRRNLLIYGLNESENEDVESVVKNFFIEKLEMPRERVMAMIFVNSHRLPRMVRPDSPPLRQTPTPVIVKFVRVPDKDAILKATRMRAAFLRQNHLSVRTDLPRVLKERRAKLLKKAYVMRNELKLQTRLHEKGIEVSLLFRRNSGDSWRKIEIDEDPKLLV